MTRVAEIVRISAVLLLAVIFTAGCGEDSQTVAGAGGSVSGPKEGPPESAATTTPYESFPPAPSWTPLPVATAIPGSVDLSGDWTITVPTLGVVCPAFVAQVGASVELDLTCLGLTAKLTGSVDANGRFSATGSAPSLCPTLGVTGTVSAEGDRLSGEADCAGQMLAFEGPRGAPPLTPTPLATVTPKPAGTPGDFDLTGNWTITVPMLGMACPAKVSQGGTSLAVELSCAGMTARLTGGIEADGTLALDGALLPLCPAVSLTGSAAADGDSMHGEAHCDGLVVPFEGRRAVAPTPTPTWTPRPPVTPGDFDLTGEWTISVPMLGASCPATVVQVGDTLEISTPCAGIEAKLTGEIGESGDLFATGSAPSLCSTLDLTATVTDGGDAIRGNATCDGLQFAFEGMRRSAPDEASLTDYLLPRVRTTESAG